MMPDITSPRAAGSRNTFPPAARPLPDDMESAEDRFWAAIAILSAEVLMCAAAILLLSILGGAD